MKTYRRSSAVQIPPDLAYNLVMLYWLRIRLPLSIISWLPVVPLCLFMLFAVACGDAAERSSPVVPTPAPSPTAPPPSETAQLSPAPTVTFVASEAVSSPTAAATCDHEYFFEPAPDSCPAGVPIASAAAEQPFEGGVMIWLEESDSVIVFFEDGRWQRFEDTWSEDQPESDPSLAPPAERFQPIRGFGKVWRERTPVREALGWALGVELAYEATVQDQASTADRPDITYLQTYNGQVYALIQRGADEGDWVIAADDR